jgi:plasmid stabilization system protein ParE
MGTTLFQVRLTDSAWNDLNEIDDYWATKGEPERGEQYVRDLLGTAEKTLSSPLLAESGRPVRVAILPNTKELLVFKGSYRIIYRIESSESNVYVLRFWHSHREDSKRGAV